MSLGRGSSTWRSRRSPHDHLLECNNFHYSRQPPMFRSKSLSRITGEDEEDEEGAAESSSPQSPQPGWPKPTRYHQQQQQQQQPQQQSSVRGGIQSSLSNKPELSPWAYRLFGRAAPGRQTSHETSSKSDQAGTGRKGGLNLLWTPSWLTPPTRMRVQDQKRARRMEKHREDATSDHTLDWRNRNQRAPVIRRTPMLTVILLQLDEALSSYCETLSQPTASRAAAAARLLDSSAASTAAAANVVPSALEHKTTRLSSSADSSPANIIPSSPTLPAPPATAPWSPQSVHSSPGYGAPSKSPSMVAQRRFVVSLHEPNRENHRHRGIGGGGGGWHAFGKRKKQRYGQRSNSPNSDTSDASWSPTISGSPKKKSNHTTGSALRSNITAMALEAEWDRYASPLLLLAGAEALYGRMEHVVDITHDAAAAIDAGEVHTTFSPTSPTGGKGLGRALRRTFQPPSPDRRRNRRGTNTTPSRKSVGGDVSSRSVGDNYQGGTEGNDKSKKLLAMYDKVRDDLIIVKEILCDPFLGDDSGVNSLEKPTDPMMKSSAAHPPQSPAPVTSASDATASISLSNTGCGTIQTNFDTGQLEDRDQPAPQNATQNEEGKARKAASSLTRTFQTILQLVNIRMELIQIQTELFSRGGTASCIWQHGLLLTESRSRDDETTSKDDSVSTITAVAAAAAAAASMVLDEDSHETDKHHHHHHHRPRPSFLDLSTRCEELISSLPPVATYEQYGSALPMVQSIQHEGKVLSSALASAHYLTHCSFFETVLNMKKLKVHLCASASSAPLHMWFRTVLQNLLSIMPIVFDRIETFSSPLYGFQKHFLLREGGLTANGDAELDASIDGQSAKLGHVSGAQELIPNASLQTQRDCPDDTKVKSSILQNDGDSSSERFGIPNDYDVAIRDFLLKHERERGGSLAVAIVLDADGAGHPPFERGFSCGAGESKEDESNKDVDRLELREWPAIYMRTTLHSGAASAAGDSGLGGGLSVATRIRRSGNSLLLGKRSGLFQSQLLMNTPSSRELVAVNEHSLNKAPTRQSGSFSITSPHAVDRKHSASTDLSVSSTTTKVGRDTRLNVLEYDPTSGHVNWPYTEWPQIVPFFLGLLDTSSQVTPFTMKTDDGHTHVFGRAVTYRGHAHKYAMRGSLVNTDDGVGPDQSAPSSIDQHLPLARYPSAVSIGSLTDAGSTGEGGAKTGMNSSATSSPKQSQIPGALSSVYHIVRLNTFMWMVVIVKGEEEKWHRRRSRGLSDEEIRSFLNDMSSKLSVDRLFSVRTVVSVRSASQRLELPALARSVTLSNLWSGSGWQDSENHQFVNSLKNMLGLRQASPLMQPLKRPYSPGLLKSQLSNRSFVWSARAVPDHEHSALVFFFGPELCQCLGLL